MTLEELRPHLHTDAEQPGVDPVPHVLLHADLGVLSRARAQLDELGDGLYDVVDRQHSRAGLVHLRRVLPARGAR